MQLIDCFSDIFTYTLHFLEREGGIAGKTEDRPRLIDEVAPVSGMQEAVAASFENRVSPPKLRSLTQEDAKGVDASENGAVFTFEKVRDTYRRLISYSRELCRRGSYPREDYELAKFAVCAWVDEMVSISNWREKMKWPKAELQRLHFNTTNAGEEFYEKLGDLKPAQVEVMEVYATCLTLGFRGCYYQPNSRDELEGIKMAACRAVLGCSPEQETMAGRTLFTGAYSTQQVSAEVVKRHELWGKFAVAVCCALLPLGIFLAMHMAYSHFLDGLQESFKGIF